MRRKQSSAGKWAASLALTMLMVIAPVAHGEVRTSEVPVNAQVPILWQRHQAKFSYVGITTLYVCDALESQVTRILRYFGARSDLKVTASCSQPVTPSRQAVIETEFYAPVMADGITANGVTGRWTPVGLTSGHPNFIGAGDCELIEDMKGLVTTSFSLRNLLYSTSCFPNELTLDDFIIKGEALKYIEPAVG